MLAVKNSTYRQPPSSAIMSNRYVGSNRYLGRLLDAFDLIAAACRLGR